MNETALLKLKVIVERAVRPVKASFQWKNKTREELLAHISAVFEDELPLCTDETAALIRVEQRFGDPGELSRTLQESVPINDRFGYLIERLAAPRSGESLARQAGRYGTLSFVASSLICITFLLIAFPFILRAGETIEYCIYALTSACVSFGVMTFLANLFQDELGQSLSGKSGWPLFKQRLLWAGYYVLVPASIPCVLFIAMSTIVPGHIITFWRLIAVVYVNTMIASISISIAKLLSIGNRYRERWSKLNID